MSAKRKYYKVDITNNNTEETDVIALKFNNDTDLFDTADNNQSAVRVYSDPQFQTNLPYWIEEWDTDNHNATIWVKLAVPANSAETIYVEVNNSYTEDLSNIDDVMIFGDDFTTDTLNTDKWDSSLSTNFASASIDTTNHYMFLPHTGTNTAFHIVSRPISLVSSSSLIIEGGMYVASSEYYVYCGVSDSIDYITIGYATYSGYESAIKSGNDGDGTRFVYLPPRITTAASTDGDIISGISNQWNNFQLVNHPGDSFIWCISNGNETTSTRYIPQSFNLTNTRFYFGGNLKYQSQKLSAIKIHKYLPQDPIVTITTFNPLHKSKHYKTVISNNNTEETDVIALKFNDDVALFDAADNNQSAIRVYSDPQFQTNLPYWIEEWDTDNHNATIWVKLAVPANSTDTIYVEADNSHTEDLSNIDETMIFGDDFKTDTIGTKWIVQGDYNNWSINNDHLISAYINTSYQNYPSLYGAFNDDANYIYEYKAKHTETIGSYPSLMVVIKTTSENYSLYGRGYMFTSNCNGGSSASNSIYIYLVNNGTISALTTTNTYVPYNVFNKYQIKYINGTIICSINGVSISVNDTTFLSGNGIRIDSQNNYISTVFDYIFVHKYLPSDPIVTITPFDNKAVLDVTVHDDSVEYVAHDDFESDSIFTLSGTANISTTQAFSGTHSVELPQGTGTPTSAAVHQFTWPNDGYLVIEAKEYVAATGCCHLITFTTDGVDGWVGPHIAVGNVGGTTNAGILECYYNNAWHSTGYSLPINQWNNLRAVIDISNATFDLYVNGDKKISGGAYHTAIAPGSTVYLQFDNWNNNNTDFFVDNVSITHVSNTKLVDPASYTYNPSNTLSYPVKLTLSSDIYEYANAKEAIRIYADKNLATEIPYWIEFFDTSATNAIIWVKPVLKEGADTPIYIYIDNSYTSTTEDLNSVFNSVINGVVGAWNFDEGSGTIAHDTSGNNNDGTLINGPTWVDGVYGKALSFDGSNDYVKLANENGQYPKGSFTLSALVKANSFPDTGDDGVITDINFASSSVASRCGGIRFKLGTQTNEGKPALEFFTSGDQSSIQRVTASSALNLGQWYHIVTVRDALAGVSYIYIDGVENAFSTTLNDNIIYNYGSYDDNSVNIGRFLRSGFAGKSLNGLIDEVHIYNTALTADQIALLYNNYGYTTPNYPGKTLVAEYAATDPQISVSNASVEYQMPSEMSVGQTYSAFINATLSSNNEISTVAVDIGGETFVLNGSEGTLSITPTVETTAGTYATTFTITDIYGNSYLVNAQDVQIDIPIQVYIDSVSQPVYSNMQFDVQVSASSAANIDHIDVVYNEATLTVNGNNTSNLSGTVSFTAQDVSTDTQANITATAYDINGTNVSVTTTVTVQKAPYTFVRDGDDYLFAMDTTASTIEISMALDSSSGTYNTIKTLSNTGSSVSATIDTYPWNRDMYIKVVADGTDSGYTAGPIRRNLDTLSSGSLITSSLFHDLTHAVETTINFAKLFKSITDSVSAFSKSTGDYIQSSDIQSTIDEVNSYAAGIHINKSKLISTTEVNKFIQFLSQFADRILATHSVESDSTSISDSISTYIEQFADSATVADSQSILSNNAQSDTLDVADSQSILANNTNDDTVLAVDNVSTMVIDDGTYKFDSAKWNFSEWD